MFRVLRIAKAIRSIFSIRAAAADSSVVAKLQSRNDRFSVVKVETVMTFAESAQESFAVVVLEWLIAANRSDGSPS